MAIEEGAADQQARRENAAEIEEKYIYRGRKVTLRVDRITDAEGHSYEREVVVHGGAVVVIPVDADGKIVMVRQWRRPVQKVLLELPAGTLEPDEPPIETAGRELQEEIGYRAAKITPLGGFYSAPGFCTEYLHLFLAENLQESRLDPDAHEVIEVHRYTLDQALDLIEQGEIQDAKSVASLCRYYAQLTRK
jgi:ADP-ribose pyrophosphatase